MYGQQGGNAFMTAGLPRVVPHRDSALDAHGLDARHFLYDRQANLSDLQCTQTQVEQTVRLYQSKLLLPSQTFEQT